MTIAQYSKNRASVLGTNLLVIGFIVSMAFPYVQFLPLDGYNQPYYLVIGFFVAGKLGYSSRKTMPLKDFFAMLWLAGLGVLLFVITCFPYDNAQEYKYLANYLTPVVLTVACFTTLQHFRNLTIKALEGSVLVWFSVAIIQTTIDPTFMTWVIGSWSESALDVVESGRGVLGLAPEPTHHGLHILLLGACLTLIEGKRWLYILCIFEAVLLARSSSSILALGVGFGLLSLAQPRRITLLTFTMIVGLLLISGISESLPKDIRLIQLISQFFESPLDFMMIDYSVNVRLGGLYATFSYVLDHFFVPQGLSHEHWLSLKQEFLERNEWLLDVSDNGPPSGIGVLLLQAGLLVVPFFLISFATILQAPSNGYLGKWLIVVGLVIFLGQFYISSPMYSLIYGCAIHATLRKSCHVKRSILANPVL